jgi:FixJ family two-component response regulator
MSGLALQRELVRQRLLVPVIFVSGLPDIALAVEAMSAGAFHILQKPIRADELSSVLFRAIRADRSRREARLLERALLTRFECLTSRELEVLEQVISGATNKEIADKLSISFRTVESHRSNIMEKLKVDSVAKLFELSFQFKRIQKSVHSG